MVKTKWGGICMEALRNKIIQEGRLRPGDMLDVESFLSHQVDTQLLGQMADELSHRLDLDDVTKILTAEASGIPFAAICAYRFGLPMVYAKKVKTELSDTPVYKSTVFSFTYERPTTFFCDVRFLQRNDKVLLVDDFLAGGQSMRALVDIVNQSGAQLVAIAVAIEKKCEGGGDRLRADGHRVEALATITGASKKGLTFA